MNVNRFKKAVAANLTKLDQKFDELKTTAFNAASGGSGGGGGGDSGGGGDGWNVDDLNPMSTFNNNNFPVDMPPTLEINGQTYRVIKLLDEGGYSFVFTVRHIDTGREYALKRLLIQEEEMMKLAMNEIKVMEQVNGHPNIIRFEGYKKLSKGGGGGGGGQQYELYILMELADDSLISVMQKKADIGDHFSEDELLNIFLQVCKAVGHMHSQNPPISHRDLKVENVLISSDGTYKLCDFGSCTTAIYTLEDKNEKMIAEEDIQKHTTMAYRAPEMADLYSGWTIDEKADVWALGCVLYKMCYFVGPFEEASTLQIINCKYRIPSENTYSNRVIDLIRYMLEVNPEKRPSVFDVIERTASLLGVSVNVTRPAPRARPTKATASPRATSQVRAARTSNTTVRRNVGVGGATSGGVAHTRTNSNNIPAPRVTTSGAPQATSNRSASSGGGGGGDLFGMIDWFDNDGGVASKPTSAPATHAPSNTFGNNSFGDDDDSWTADFSQLDMNSSSNHNNVPAPSSQRQQQQQPVATRQKSPPIRPPSPKGNSSLPAVHTRQTSITTSNPSPKSGNSSNSGASSSVSGDLFGQLDWQDSNSGSGSSNLSPTSPPVAVTSPTHRRTQSSQSNTDFNLDSLFTAAPDNEPSIAKILSLPGNRACADCNTRDPKNAIVNLGTLVCDACANIHRTLGDQISRVYPLDERLTMDQIKYMCSVGNSRANNFWEATLNDPMLKPQNALNVGALNTYIRNKYLGKRFAPIHAHRLGPRPNVPPTAAMNNTGVPLQAGLPPRPLNTMNNNMPPPSHHHHQFSPTSPMRSPMSPGPHPHHQRVHSTSSIGSHSSNSSGDINFDAFRIMK